MKNTFNLIKLFTVCLVLVIFSSCEKHDFFDDNLIVGETGPQAYWELTSATVTAGAVGGFEAQYYSTVSEPDHSELWYNIVETLDKSVSCPWVTTFAYSYTSTTTEEKRVLQKVEEYPHSLAVWSDSLRAYTLTGEFPVSGTLSSFQWYKPSQFDSTRMETYFGEDFMRHFKDSLYGLMEFADFQKMYLGMELLEDFSQYTDSTEDKNSGEYVYHFPLDSQGNTPVPAEIKEIYDGIPFDKLIENTSNSVYEVEYKRSYTLEAVLRVYDIRGVYGLTVKKEIEIN